jgi:hypothetical protein
MSQRNAHCYSVTGMGCALRERTSECNAFCLDFSTFRNVGGDNAGIRQ